MSIAIETRFAICAFVMFPPFEVHKKRANAVSPAKPSFPKVFTLYTAVGQTRPFSP